MNQHDRGNGYEMALGGLTETGRHGGGGGRGGGRGRGGRGGRRFGGRFIRGGFWGVPWGYGWGNYGWNPANQYALWWQRQLAYLQNLRAYLIEQASEMTDGNLIAQLQEELDQLAQQVAFLQGQLQGQGQPQMPMPQPQPEPMPGTSGWGGGGCTGGCGGGYGFAG